jgi:hypothetical protein
MLLSVRCSDGIDGVQMTMGGWKKTQFRLCVSEKASRRQGEGKPPDTTYY